MGTHQGQAEIGRHGHQRYPEIFQALDDSQEVYATHLIILLSHALTVTLVAVC